MRIPLLLALQARGFDVSAVGSERGDDFLRYKIPYWRYPLKRWVTPVHDVRSALRLYALFRKHRPDIIHAFDTKPNILAPVIGGRTGVNVRVRTLTGLGYIFSSDSLIPYSLRPVYRFLQQWAARSTDMTIFQNPDDRDYFVKNRIVQSSSAVIVPGSGIDVKRFGNDSPGNNNGLSQLKRRLEIKTQVVVTMVARLVKTKGVREYIEAARLVRQRMDDVTFLLVGPLFSEGQQAISLKDVEQYSQYVRYLGQRDDVPQLLALTDIFVLPSYYREGIPRVLLEAGAMGLPLITTNTPGCKEVVRDGWNGFLVPPRDVKALSEAILRIGASQSMRTEMGVRSKIHIRQFDLENIAGKYAELYHQLLKEKFARAEEHALASQTPS